MMQNRNVLRRVKGEVAKVQAAFREHECSSCFVTITWVYGIYSTYVMTLKQSNFIFNSSRLGLYLFKYHLLIDNVLQLPLISQIM